MGAADSSYRYERLDEAEREFRLLRLVPDSDAHHDEPGAITAELHVASLENPPNFTALSYRWTKASAIHSIKLRGRRFMVRPNLFDYLKVLKAEKFTGLVFVDAICIDQDNMDEKSSQVRLMGGIYRSAIQVTAWLAPPSSGLDPITEIFCSENLKRLVDERVTFSLSTGDMSLESLVIRMFTTPEYWSRLWVVQEVVLARDLVLQLGRFKISGDLLADLLIKTESSDPLSHPHHDVEHTSELRYQLTPGERPWSWLSANNLMHFRKAYNFRNGRKITLSRALITFAYQLCEAPHDKVFAMLGLIVDSIRADYRIPLSELYIRVLLIAYCETALLRNGQVMKARSYLGNADTVARLPLYLARAFGWSILHPLIALLAQETVGRLRSDITDHFLLSTAVHHEIWAPGSMTRRKLVSYAAGAVHTAVQMRLQISSMRNAVMAMPDDPADARPYSDWVQLVQTIFVEIRDMMYSPEYIARLEQAFPAEDASEVSAQQLAPEETGSIE